MRGEKHIYQVTWSRKRDGGINVHLSVGHQADKRLTEAMHIVALAERCRILSEAIEETIIGGES